jgi:hypothetical protein
MKRRIIRAAKGISLESIDVQPAAATSSKMMQHQRNLSASLQLAFYRLGGKNYERSKLVTLGLVCFCLVAGLTFSALSSLVKTKEPFPWKSMNRKMMMSSQSKTYTVPDSLTTYGDKSHFYSKLREAYDSLYPSNAQRSLQVVRDLQQYHFESRSPMDGGGGGNNTSSMIQPYNIYNCPDLPPVGYPYAWNIIEILHHWPSDDPEPRPQLHQAICVFDYQKDHAKAMAYRDAELPFVVKGDPQVAKTVERWNAPHYMDALLGNIQHETEYSETSHFLYWDPSKQSLPAAATTQQQPTKIMHMAYAEWFEHANATEDMMGPDKPHWYYKLVGCGSGRRCNTVRSEYLFDELAFFQPKKKSLYLKEPKMQTGILCRFGMKGVIAENHFDGSRNAITVLRGERRYILAHPNQCDRMALYPKGHPSGRHSAVDWSDPDLEEYPAFALAKGNEVVLQAGDVLYLPTHWFHYIISLSLNFQCNTRGGVGSEHAQSLIDCGYPQ